MTRPEIEPWSPGPLANTLPVSQWAGTLKDLKPAHNFTKLNNKTININNYQIK